MPILTVGTNQQYATLAAAVQASHDGDTIYVQAGNYVNDFSEINTKINIVGVGGMVHLIANASPPNGKAILTTNTDVTIDHLEFSGAAVPDGNGAGIRDQAGNLTITNSYFHDNQDGILTAAIANGKVTIDRSEFDHNGAGDGQTHNLYVGAVGELDVTNSYLHDAVVGHELKSRAFVNVISNNRIFDNNGSASYSIDLPNGGNATIQNNVIQQGPNSQNSTIIAYGEEGGVYGGSQLSVQGNTIINQRNPGLGVWNATTVTAQISGNHIYGLSGSQIASGPNNQSNNDTLSTAPALDTSHPWAASPWDNLVSGGAGNDTLAGTAGRDLFVGGGGNDTFNIASGGGSDTIADFHAGDLINISGYSLADFAAVQGAMTQVGADTVLALGSGDTLTFLGMQKTAFDAGEFSFASGTATGNPPPTTAPPPDNTSSNPPPSNPPPPADSPPSGPVVQPFSLPESGTPEHNFTGNGRPNSIHGTSGNDNIDGGGGNDTMRGDLGDDTYHVDSSRDSVVEKAGQGIDTVIQTAKSYYLPANVENLMLSGSQAHSAIGNTLDNLITASDANDTIIAGAGNDIIRAGLGAGTFSGGPGHDMFVFSAIGGSNQITDFHIGEDLVDLRSMFSSYAGKDPVADGVLALSSDGAGGAIVSVDPTHEGTLHPIADLQHVAPNALRMGYDILWHTA